MDDRYPNEEGTSARLWFELTASEKRVVCLVLALGIMGVGIKYWHYRKERGEPPRVTSALRTASVETRQGAQRARDGKHREGAKP